MGDLIVSFEGCTPFEFSEERVLKAFEMICSQSNKILGDMSLVFCSNEFIHETNVTFLNHDYPTDIITFDFCEGSVVSGDLLIGLEVVRENSLEYNTRFEFEMFRVCLHGVLHLVGYCDKTEEDRLVMRSKEEEFLLLFDSPFIDCFT